MVVCEGGCVYALLSYLLHIIPKFDPILLNLSQKWRDIPLRHTRSDLQTQPPQKNIMIQTWTVSCLFVGGGGGGGGGGVGCGGRGWRAFYHWAAAWLYSSDPAVGDYLFYEPIFLLLGFLLLIEGAAGLSW